MQIKIKRARKLCSTGKYPDSFAAMLALVPCDVQAALTSHELAAMIDVLWAACERSKAIAERAACSHGYIWDSRRQVMGDIA